MPEIGSVSVENDVIEDDGGVGGSGGGEGVAGGAEGGAEVGGPGLKVGEVGEVAAGEVGESACAGGFVAEDDEVFGEGTDCCGR